MATFARGVNVGSSVSLFVIYHFGLKCVTEDHFTSSSLCTRYCQKEQIFQVSGLQAHTHVEVGPEDEVSVPRDFTTHSGAATSLGQFCQYITVPPHDMEL